METNFDYYRRRAAEELSAAERAPDGVIAAVHRSMAERYMALSEDGQLSDTKQEIPIIRS